MRRAARALLACWLWSFFAAGCRADAEPLPKQTGVVIEEIAEGSALGKAGLQPGDVLLSWERLPDRGEIESDFDWLWLAIEQAPRGAVTLAGERAAGAVVFEVGPGTWDTRVRPVLPDAMLERYSRGRERLEADDLSAGIGLWREILPLAQEYGEPHVPAWIHLRIGQARSQAREWEKAHAAYRSALGQAPGPRARVAIWDAIGAVYERQGDLEGAATSYRSAQEIREAEWGESLQLARSWHLLGRVALNGARSERAAEHGQRALAIFEQLAPGSLDAATTLNNLGIAARQHGDLRLAAEYHERAWEIRKDLAPGSLAAAQSLNNLGGVAAQRGDLESADDDFRRSLEILEKRSPGGLRVAQTLSNLAGLVLQRGDLDGAEEYHERALAILEKTPPYPVVPSLVGLGNVAQRRGELESAVAHYRRALETLEARHRGGLGMAYCLSYLGAVALLQGETEGAERHHRRALEILEKVAPGSLEKAWSLGNLAAAVTDRDPEAATELYRRALEIQQRLAPGSWQEAETLEALGSLFRRLKRPDLAEQHFRRSIDALEAQVGRLGGSPDARGGFRARHDHYYRNLIELLLPDRAQEAFFILESSRARSLLDLLAERDMRFHRDVPEALEQARSRLTARFDGTQGKLLRLNPEEAPERVDALRGELRSLRRQLELNAVEIRRTSPELAALEYPQPLGLAEVRGILDPGTVMLSYNVGEEHTDLFVVTRESGLEVRLLASGHKTLEADVARLRGLIQGPLWSQRLAAFVELSERLYATLIEPAAEAIAAGKRVLIVPDGPLRLLPWSALLRESPDGGTPLEGRQYLAEWKPLHSVLSATLYGELKESRRSSPTAGAGRAPMLLAAFGDPRYPPELTRGNGEISDARLRSAVERGLDDWRPLPYSRREIEGISGLYPPGTARVFLGEEATEERAKALGREARIVHFAVHSHLDDLFPLNSGLVLTVPEGFPADRDNGLLQAWEIFENVRLDANLVVLSACESALGPEQGGEGLIGLTRAFHYAGARSVAATLWSVDDQVTAELMERFYRHLRAGEPKDAALRAAQVELLRGPVQVRTEQGKRIEIDASAPFFWAAFQIFGDWR